MATLVDYIQQLPHYGEKTALVFQTPYRTFSWSYQGLYQQVQKTATFLGNLGVGQGDSVVLWASNSPQWAILFMAILYRGAVAVPADVGASSEFVGAITRETEAGAVFRSRLREQPPVESPVLLMEDLLDDIRSLPPQQSPSQVRKEDTAQILYTSGTTGAPKGVVLTHHNITANLKGIDQVIVIDSDHLLISILPLSHIFEQSIGFWTPLIHGATVVHLQVLKLSELFRAKQRYPLTELVLVPQFLDLFRDHIQRQVGGGIQGKVFQRLLPGSNRLLRQVRYLLFFPVRREMGRSFRFFVVGGAPLDPELERFWNQMGFLVLQGYGLTETSPVVTLNSPQAFKPGSVGRSLPGVEVVIADDGEVLVHGESVTMGYFKAPERTRETIIDGWLRTGDLGYMDQEGFLFLRGRKKDLIVTSAGLNVYPEDVEAVFHRLPGVRDVAVLEFEGQVHAVLLLEHGGDAGAVVEQANASLAEHQRVQEYTVWMEEDFPRTTTHKPKKHEIRATLEQMARGGAPPQPSQEEQPVGEVERILVRVSGKPTSAITPEARLGDDLGLDSLDRIELVGWLEEQLNTEVAEEELTEETTVQDLKQMVGQGATQHLHLARWALSRPACVARWTFQQGLVFPIYNRIVRQCVEGLEHLDNLDGPIIFTPNHTSYLDTVALLQALPPRFRQRLAPAQYAEFFEVPPGRMDLWLRKKFLFFFLTLGFNIYLLAQTRGVRQSFQYTGELLDKGWNVLVFPEGRRTCSGGIGPFREGIGILAAEMRVPVVPVHIEGLYKVLPRHRSRPRRGDVVVRFGKPLEFYKESYGDFTQRLEDAVRNLDTLEKSRRAV